MNYNSTVDHGTLEQPEWGRWQLLGFDSEVGAADQTDGHMSREGRNSILGVWVIPFAVTHLSSKELSTKERPFPSHSQVDADAFSRGAAL